MSDDLAAALCRKTHPTRWEFQTGTTSYACDDCELRAADAHRWYAERLASDDVREAAARAIVEHTDEPMWSAMVIARRTLAAVRDAARPKETS